MDDAPSTTPNVTGMSRVPSRAALVGNPSDNHGGAVLGLALSSIAATVRVVNRSSRPSLDPELMILLDAARAVAVDAGWPVPDDLDWFVDTNIPREVGLSGSSAIVLGAVESLARLVGAEFVPEVLAAMALSAEVDVLGWAAGLQDRVLQALDRPLLMDFAPGLMVDVDGWPVGRYTPVDPGLMPPLVFVAYSTGLSERSDARLRRQGAPADRVQAVMDDSARLARSSLAYLKAGDLGSFGEAMRGSFRNRCAVFGVRPEQIALVETYEAIEGIAANSAGSGGSIVGAAVAGDPVDSLSAVRRVAADNGHGVVVWSPTPGSGPT
ncbi:MAG: hypothetical protein GY925_21055 [Actinomycetia bacterium]|nr:hypothetical protein [Actinomycetes bacterium]